MSQHENPAEKLLVQSCEKNLKHLSFVTFKQYLLKIISHCSEELINLDESLQQNDCFVTQLKDFSPMVREELESIKTAENERI